ncbi:MAG TPA: HD-GYP domain-containing protein [Azospirillum sp.]
MRPLSAHSISILYAAFGTVWILAGYGLATLLFGVDMGGHYAFEIAKGLIYVAMTTGALWLLLRREFRRRDQAERGRLAALTGARSALDQTAEALGRAVERRDPYTAGHQARVALLSAAIAGRLGLNEGQVEGIRLGALMHDIGKIGIPAELLSKPGRLEPQEFELIKLHTVYGHDIVKRVEFDDAIHRIVLEHHERMDGSGYPHGLAGDVISLEARIVAVADVVEAITSHRPYRPAKGLDAACEELRSQRGTKLDTEATDACLALLEDGFRF